MDLFDFGTKLFNWLGFPNRRRKVIPNLRWCTRKSMISQCHVCLRSGDFKEPFIIWTTEIALLLYLLLNKSLCFFISKMHWTCQIARDWSSRPCSPRNSFCPRYQFFKQQPNCPCFLYISVFLNSLIASFLYFHRILFFLVRLPESWSSRPCSPRNSFCVS